MSIFNKKFKQDVKRFFKSLGPKKGKDGEAVGGFSFSIGGGDEYDHQSGSQSFAKMICFCVCIFSIFAFGTQGFWNVCFGFGILALSCIP